MWPKGGARSFPSTAFLSFLPIFALMLLTIWHKSRCLFFRKKLNPRNVCIYVNHERHKLHIECLVAEGFWDNLWFLGSDFLHRKMRLLGAYLEIRRVLASDSSGDRCQDQFQEILLSRTSVVLLLRYSFRVCRLPKFAFPELCSQIPSFALIE